MCLTIYCIIVLYYFSHATRRVGFHFIIKHISFIRCIFAYTTYTYKCVCMLTRVFCEMRRLTSLVPRLSPHAKWKIRTASDGKLGRAWERGYQLTEVQNEQDGYASIRICTFYTGWSICNCGLDLFASSCGYCKRQEHYLQNSNIYT